MTTAQAIAQRLMSLPEDAQREVLDFVEFVKSRRTEQTRNQKTRHGRRCHLRRPMRGMEDEESPYTLGDLKESFR